MRRGATLVSAAVCATSIGAAGCAASTTDDGSTTLRVAAAASLTGVLDDLVESFEAERVDVDVETSLGGSSSLAVSIAEGAPVDVFVSANEAVMDDLVDRGAVDGPATVFATNDVVLAVPTDGTDDAAGTGADITSIEDFARSDLFLGACAPQVPCGSYADELFELAGVEPSFDTRDADVRAVVTKLLEGELDGGVVYASDVAEFDDRLAEVALPPDVSVVARYPAAVVAETSMTGLAREFVGFLTSATAQGQLRQAGFGAP